MKTVFVLDVLQVALEPKRTCRLDFKLRTTLNDVIM